MLCKQSKYSNHLFDTNKSNSSFCFSLFGKEGQGEGRDERGEEPAGEGWGRDGGQRLTETEGCHTSRHLAGQSFAVVVVVEADVCEAPEEEEHEAEGDWLGDGGHCQVVVDDEDADELTWHKLI